MKKRRRKVNLRCIELATSSPVGHGENYPDVLTGRLQSSGSYDYFSVAVIFFSTLRSLRSVVHTETRPKATDPRSDAFYGETYPPIVRVRDNLKGKGSLWGWKSSTIGT